MKIRDLREMEEMEMKNKDPITTNGEMIVSFLKGVSLAFALVVIGYGVKTGAFSAFIRNVKNNVAIERKDKAIEEFNSRYYGDDSHSQYGAKNREAIDDIVKMPVYPGYASSNSAKKEAETNTEAEQYSWRDKHEVVNCDIYQLLSENGIRDFKIDSISGDTTHIRISATGKVADDVDVHFVTFSKTVEEHYQTSVRIHMNGYDFRCYFDNPSYVTDKINCPAWRSDSTDPKAKESRVVYVDENLNFAISKNELKVLKYITDGGEIYGRLFPRTAGGGICYFSTSPCIEDSMYATDEEKAEKVTFSEYVASGMLDAYNKYRRENIPTPTPRPSSNSTSPYQAPTSIPSQNTESTPSNSNKKEEGSTIDTPGGTEDSGVPPFSPEAIMPSYSM